MRLQRFPMARRYQGTWDFLDSHYDIEMIPESYTNTLVQVEPDLDLRQFKQIAICIIYFEAAFEALVALSSKRSLNLKSHHRDGLIGFRLPRNREGRLASIATIYNAINRDAVYQLMQGGEDFLYAWNFNGLFTHGTRKAITFRKAAFYDSSRETLRWTELVMSFFQAARRPGTLRALLGIPANIGGLARFLMLGNSEGVSQPHRLRRLFAGKNPEAAIEPCWFIRGEFLWRTKHDQISRRKG